MTTAQFFRVKDWDTFQHYRDRTPPWIRFYNSVLDDYEIGNLPDASKAHLFAIWLLASRYDNKIPLDPTWIATKINARSPVDLDALLKSGKIEIIQSRTKTLAQRKQVDAPEQSRAETEQSREENKGGAVAPSPEKPSEDRNAKRHGTRLPADWQPDGKDRAYAEGLGLDVERTLEDFRDYWLAKAGSGACKLDWSRTWRRWCRENADRRKPRGLVAKAAPAGGGGFVAAIARQTARAMDRVGGGQSPSGSDHRSDDGAALGGLAGPRIGEAGSVDQTPGRGLGHDRGGVPGEAIPGSGGRGNLGHAVLAEPEIGRGEILPGVGGTQGTDRDADVASAVDPGRAEAEGGVDLLAIPDYLRRSPKPEAAE